MKPLKVIADQVTLDAVNDPVVAGLLAQILARLDAIDAKLDPDRSTLERLYPIIAPIVGDLTFTTAELFERALLPGHDALAKALAAMNARQLGRLFMRMEGIAVAGYAIHAVGTSDQGRVFILKPIGTIAGRAR